MTNKYHNLYQIINDFHRIDSIDSIVSEEFDLEYRKTVYNAVSGRFDAVDDVSVVDNKKTLGNLYIEEFINDFASYWRAIDETVARRIPDFDIYVAVKKDMIRLIRSFSIYKGTEFFIKFVYDLYATLTTTEFWLGRFVVVSNSTIFSNFKNLEYNLTGTLPSHVWENIIKPTIHPAGWICNYFGNEYTEYYDIVSYDNHLRNDLCYIDYAGCNSVVNTNAGLYYFDGLLLFGTDLLKTTKTTFQFDVINVGGSIVDEPDVDL
jgi:hypothetical protein